MAQPVHIAQIVADGRPGGGTTMVLGLIDDLVQGGGIEITLVSQPGSYAQAQAQARGLRFVGLDTFGTGPNPLLPFLLAQRLQGQRFDLAHVHGLRAAHHATRWPARRHWRRIVYTVHGLHQLHLAPWQRALANIAERRAMQRADATVFVSQADRRLAAAWTLAPRRSGGEVIPNGIDLGAFARGVAENAGGRDFDVAFVGRHVPQKQPLLAARVLAVLAQQGWRCAMVGGGPLEHACRALLGTLAGGDRVRCMGEQSHTAALGAIAGARVLLMPSAWEGLPLLPMEAMALGVPVVATRRPSIDEVVDDGVTGVLVDSPGAGGDTAPWVEAVRSILQDREFEQRLRIAGRKRVETHFSRAAGSARYRSLYARVLGDAA